MKKNAIRYVKIICYADENPQEIIFDRNKTEKIYENVSETTVRRISRALRGCTPSVVINPQGIGLSYDFTSGDGWTT